MRCTQFIGLNDWAKQLLHTMHLQVPTKDKWDGMSGESGNLYKYTLFNGKKITEYVQATIWSSGPCIFLALKDEAGDPIPESLWSDEEINEE